MAKITYRMKDSGAETTEWHGVAFEDGKAVTTDNALLIAAAKDNPYFDVSGDTKDDAEEAKAENREIKRRGRPPIMPIGVPVDADQAEDA